MKIAAMLLAALVCTDAAAIGARGGSGGARPAPTTRATPTRTAPARPAKAPTTRPAPVAAGQSSNQWLLFWAIAIAAQPSTARSECPSEAEIARAVVADDAVDATEISARQQLRRVCGYAP